MTVNLDLLPADPYPEPDEHELDLYLLARQLDTWAKMLERWRADPNCDAVTCVVEGLRTWAGKLY